MLDFGPTTTTTASPPQIRVQDVVPVVQESVKIIPVPNKGVAYAMKEEDGWGWSDLRDYVITEIERRHGPSVRDPLKEAGIFKSFMSRWPDHAVAIAKCAFGPVHDGMWQNAPISVNRFCRASDDYFSAVIASRL